MALTPFDLPKMYVDMYGVHNIEFQHDTIVKSETDPEFIKELKARLDGNQMTMTQINLEFGNAQSTRKRRVTSRVLAIRGELAGLPCPKVPVDKPRIRTQM